MAAITEILAVKGTVKSYSTKKGFGFIDCQDERRDVFVYNTHLVGRVGLIPGEEVEFTLFFDGERPQARNVRVTVAAPQAATTNAKENPLEALTEAITRPAEPQKSTSEAEDDGETRQSIREAALKAQAALAVEVPTAPIPRSRHQTELEEQIRSAQSQAAEGKRNQSSSLILQGAITTSTEAPGDAFEQEIDWSQWTEQRDWVEKPVPKSKLPAGTEVRITAFPAQDLIGQKGIVKDYDADGDRYGVEVEVPNKSGGPSKTTFLSLRVNQLRIEKIPIPERTKAEESTLSANAEPFNPMGSALEWAAAQGLSNLGGKGASDVGTDGLRPSSAMGKGLEFMPSKGDLFMKGGKELVMAKGDFGLDKGGHDFGKGDVVLGGKGPLFSQMMPPPPSKGDLYAKGLFPSKGDLFAKGEMIGKGEPFVDPFVAAAKGDIMMAKGANEMMMAGKGGTDLMAIAAKGDALMAMKGNMMMMAAKGGGKDMLMAAKGDMAKGGKDMMMAAKGDLMGAIKGSKDLMMKGKGDPLLGKSDPFIGKGDPFIGKGDPYIGKGDPFIGKSDPFFGKGDPLSGKGDPFLGKGSALLGKGDLLFGKGSPPFGKGIPFLDKGDPFFGKGDPLFGKGDPSLGKGESQLGKSDPLSYKGADPFASSMMGKASGLNEIGRKPSSKGEIIALATKAGAPQTLIDAISRGDIAAARAVAAEVYDTFKEGQQHLGKGKGGQSGEISGKEGDSSLDFRQSAASVIPPAPTTAPPAPTGASPPPLVSELAKEKVLETEKQGEPASKEDTIERRYDPSLAGNPGFAGARWKVRKCADFHYVIIRKGKDVLSAETLRLQPLEICVQDGPMETLDSGVVRMPIRPEGWVTVHARLLNGPTFLDLIETEREQVPDEIFPQYSRNELLNFARILGGQELDSGHSLANVRAMRMPELCKDHAAHVAKLERREARQQLKEKEASAKEEDRSDKETAAPADSAKEIGDKDWRKDGWNDWSNGWNSQWDADTWKNNKWGEWKPTDWSNNHEENAKAESSGKGEKSKKTETPEKVEAPEKHDKPSTPSEVKVEKVDDQTAVKQQTTKSCPTQ